MSPSALRKRQPGSDDKAPRKASPKSGVTVTLGFRPPYDFAGVQRFLAMRAVPGIERLDSTGPEAFTYSRSLSLVHGGHVRSGWLSVATVPQRAELHVSLSDPLVPAMPQVLQRVRQAMDLDADPAVIDSAMARLGLPPRPGVRLPGAIDGFESAVRVILGQQVSVAAAVTLTHRLVGALGEELPQAHAGIHRLFPTPQAIAEASAETIGRLGIVRQRVGALQALAAAVHDGSLSLERDAPLEATLAALRQLPGIGEWTAQLIAMRALAWPDAFPATDLALLKALGTRNPDEARARCEPCRPWRAYAVMRCWQTLEPEDVPTPDTAP